MENGIDIEIPHDFALVAKNADANLAELGVERVLRSDDALPLSPQRLFLILTADSPRFSVVAMSATLARVLRTQSNDARGRALADLLWLTTSEASGIDAAELAQSLDRVIRTGEPDAMPLRQCELAPASGQLGGGAQRWWSAINFPMFGADGRVTHIVHRIEDLTGVLQMQLAREAWMSAVTSALPKPEVDLDCDSLLVIAADEQERALMRVAFDGHGYRLIWASSGDEALTMFTQQQPDCVLIDLTTPEVDGLGTCRRMRDLDAGAEAMIICLAALRDSSAIDGALLAGADEVLAKPISAHELFSQVEAALLKQPSISELRAHCQKLRQQRHRLCRMQLHRERVASYIVHDLKEPLSTIDLRAALLLVNDAIPAEARVSIERIRTQVRAALLQVLNLLDIHMHDEGRLVARHESVDIARMVQELLTEFDPNVQARGLRLRSDIAINRVSADPDLLRRVLANLLDNAVRHAPRNSEVSITACYSGRARVELRVQDAGPGVPEALRERIFDAFVRADATGQYTSRTGRGLGLAFCKLAVEAHDGEIRVAEIEGKTVFVISLPESLHKP